jgi:hypothetical protein
MNWKTSIMGKTTHRVVPGPVHRPHGEGLEIEQQIIPQRVRIGEIQPGADLFVGEREWHSVVIIGDQPA